MQAGPRADKPCWVSGWSAQPKCYNGREDRKEKMEKPKGRSQSNIHPCPGPASTLSPCPETPLPPSQTGSPAKPAAGAEPQGTVTQHVAWRDFSFGAYVVSKHTFHFGKGQVKGGSQFSVHPAGLGARAGVLGAGSRGLAGSARLGCVTPRPSACTKAVVMFLCSYDPAEIPERYFYLWILHELHTASHLQKLAESR